MKPAAAQAILAAAVASRSCNRLNLCGLPTLAPVTERITVPEIQYLLFEPLEKRGALRIMQILAFERCRLVGAIPSSLNQCVSLLELNISHNQISGTLPLGVGDCASLQTLTVENNRLSGPIPTAIGRCTQLRKLHLNNNQLAGAIPAELGACTSLQSLHLHANQLTGSVASTALTCATATRRAETPARRVL